MQSETSNKGAAIWNIAAVATIVTPLCLGMIGWGLHWGRVTQAAQVSRDIAVLYSRGVDFSGEGGQAVAKRLASGVNLGPRGDAAIILSQVAIVRAQDCAAAGLANTCRNMDRPVFLNRIAIGNSSLRSSSYGSPAGMNARGNIPADTYLNQESARGNAHLETELAHAKAAQRPGEIAFIVEAWFPAADLNPFGSERAAVVYARSIY